ncbi:MAG: hypothetical protein KatS3mg102_2322 [Planctomycetota bacterium]|nr:MAG: hypothetical protein KatS3mg102_2322 [Planctomycetota bacterium]
MGMDVPQLGAGGPGAEEVEGAGQPRQEPPAAEEQPAVERGERDPAAAAAMADAAWCGHLHDIGASIRGLLSRLVGGDVEPARTGMAEAARRLAQRAAELLREGTEPAGPSGGGEALAAAGAPVLGLLPRPPGAMTGSQFIEATRGMSPAAREEAILREIEAGNVPEFLRQLKAVTTTFRGADGREHTATFYAMPDYLAIGSEEDFVRIPMNPLTAQRIADRLGMSLPTTKMVDAVYEQAEIRLAPSPMPPGPHMMSNEYYLRHQRTIEGQLGERPRGALTAGHKKDVVITNRLEQRPDRVAIYGWHQPNGRPIQGLSTVHENTYADYSHGVRLVGGTVLIDGEPRPLAEVLRDPELAPALSAEGAMRHPRQPTPR